MNYKKGDIGIIVDCGPRYGHQFDIGEEVELLETPCEDCI